MGTSKGWRHPRAPGLGQFDPTSPLGTLVSPGLSPYGRHSWHPSVAFSCVQVRGCYQLTRISLLRLSPWTGRTELPLPVHSTAQTAVIPPAALPFPATTDTRLLSCRGSPCFWDLWFALSPDWLRTTQMQVRQVNITRQRDTLNWERQEMHSRNPFESKTNRHTNTETAINLAASLCVPGITSFPSCEQDNLTCLVLEWGITWASVQKLFLWRKHNLGRIQVPTRSCQGSAKAPVKGQVPQSLKIPADIPEKLL